MKRNKIKPTIKSNGLLYFGNNGINTIRSFGIDSLTIIDYFNLLTNRGLNLFSDNSKMNIEVILYLNLLNEINFNIDILISEFNKSQFDDFYNMSHSLSIIKICYHYKKNNFNIKIIKTSKKSKSPDFEIEGILCDLKVRHDKTLERVRNKLKYNNYDVDDDLYANTLFLEIRSLNQDLESAIKSRANDGFEQAQVLIFDLSDHFHSWNYHRLKKVKMINDNNIISDIPLLPKINDIIIFSSDNAINLNTSIFKPQAFWIKLCKNYCA
jgi:hypothetical protein